jgi:hypothetical protein
MTLPEDTPIMPAATVDVLRVKVNQRIGRVAADHMRVETLRDMVTGDLVAELQTALLAEQLPPETVLLEQEITTPRFASWWQHLRATYRERRWWGWLLGRRRPIRMVDEPHTLRAVVELRSWWTYPNASMVLPGDRFGPPVLHVDRPSPAVRAFPFHGRGGVWPDAPWA